MEKKKQVTKIEARELLQCLEGILKKVPQSKKQEIFGEMNTLFLFLEELEREGK